MTPTQTSIFDTPSTAKENREHHIHAALYTSSPRLQAVLKVLADGEWHTSWDITMQARTVCASTVIQELKAPINNFDIVTEYVGEQNRRKVFRYRWIRK